MNSNADAPSTINPNITRGEAAEARRKGRELPVTKAIADAAAAMALAGIPKDQIATELGYSANRGGKLLKSPEVQSALRRKLEEKGIDEDFLAEKAKTFLSAQKTHFIPLRNADGSEELIERNTEDWGTQRAAWETILELRDDFPVRRKDVAGSGGARLVINVKPEYKQIFFGDAAAVGAGQPVADLQSGADVLAGAPVPQEDHRP